MECCNQVGLFYKDTIGKQLVRAADSISADLSEGFGRYHFKEARNFGYYSRGSLFETITWKENLLGSKDLPGIVTIDDNFSKRRVECTCVIPLPFKVDEITKNFCVKFKEAS